MGLSLNLLVIEDSPADLLLIERHLREHGVEARCTSVADARQIAAALDEAMWDVVLCDFNLPGIDFFDLLKQMKARLPDVPIILVTGCVGEERAVDLLKAGVWDFVLKDRLVRLVPAIDRGLAEAADRRARRAAEQAQREGESRLQAFLDSSESIAWIKDLEGRFQVVNRYTAQLLGVPRDKLIGRTVFDIFPRELAETYSRNDRTVIESGQPIRVEERAPFVDGEHVFSSLKFPIRDASGRIYAIGALCADITGHKREQVELADAEARWSFALEGSDLGVWDWNIATDAVFYSPRWKSMLGYANDELDGRLDEWSSRVHREDMPLVQEILQRHFSGETEIYQIEHRLRCKDGKYKWILARGRVIEWTADRKPQRMIGTHADVSGRRVLEDAVRDSEARANLILDASPEAMLVVDARGYIVRSNDSADRVFGYSSGELVGMSYEELVPHDLRVAHRAYHADFISRQARRPMGNGRRLRGLRRDGEVFPAEISLAPVEIGGEPQIIVTVLDISVRRQAEIERERLARIVEISGDMLALVDRDLRFMVTNSAYADMLGTTTDRLRGRSVRDVLGPVMFADVSDRLDAALAGKQQRFSVTRRFAGGRRVALDGEYRPFVVDGEVQGIVASLRDVSARVAAEEALARAQSMALLGRWTYDKAIDCFEVSAETRRIFDWPHDSLKAADLLRFIHPDDVERVREKWLSCLTTGEPYDTEHRIFIGAGALRHIHSLAEATRDEDGHVTGLVGVMQDITEVRQAQLALQAQHEHLERLVAARTAELRQQTSYLHALIDNFPFRVWLKDTDGRYLAVNRANSDAAGLRIDQMLGHADDAILPAEIAARRLEEDRTVIAQRSPSTVEAKVTDESGSAWYETYKAPVFDADGTVIGTVGFSRDITERKALESAREAALAEAQHLARVRSDFLANMSHEIRTPLSAILGLAQVGLREDAGRRSSEAFTRIVDSGQLLLGVINDILDFSKIEAGKLTVENLPYDPCEAIDRAVDFVAAQADAKNLEFLVEESVDLPALCAGDKLRVSQVLVNLLSNAVKFTERGSVSLAAAREDAWLRFDVIDTGIGMHPGQIERLFRPFEQADTSTTRRFGGTGLGLAISGRLVELMDGKIQVESRLGEGTRFTVRLPLRDATAPKPREAVSVVLVDFDAKTAARTVDALAVRGAVAKVETATTAFAQPADLVVLRCTSVDVPLSRLSSKAIAEGRRVAIVCHHSEPCIADDALRDRLIHIEYPLRARHLVSAALAAPAAARRMLPAGQRLQGLRVLAAEDNALNRVVLEEMLHIEGASLVMAEDGERALARLHQDGTDAYDIVLTDIQMPGIDGYETARRILAFAPSLPVIGLTAHAMREERERCLAVGMVEHLAKPIDLDALVQSIRHHVPRLRELQPPKEPAAGAAAATRAAAPVAPPVIDWAALEERFPGRAAFIDKLAQTLLRTQSETPARLREAVAQDDRAALIFIAHTLKGMAGNLMAQPLHALARETEMAAREESAHTGDLARRLADAMQNVIDAVHERLAGRDAERPVESGPA